MDLTQPNYVKEMARLFDAGIIKRGDFLNVLVAHDDWCAIYDGKPCDCEPDIVDAATGKVLNRKEAKQ